MNNMSLTKRACQIVLICFYLLMAMTVPGQEGIQIRNSAQYMGSGRYDWTVCLSRDTPLSVLDSIDFVEYTLHPTFPNPVRRGEGRFFSLSTNGWDEFDILVKVVFKDGQESRITYSLNFDEKSDVCPKVPNKRGAKKRE